VVAGDTVTIDDDAVLAAFDTKDVGTAKPVTVSGLALTGADAGNYTVTQPAGLSAAITAKGLTVTGAIAQDKVYDGTTAATVDFSSGPAQLDGVVDGDAVDLDVSTYAAHFDTRNVGSDKDVTVSGLTLTGTDTGNYTLTQPVLKAAITAKGLTVTGAAANDKVYDRTTAATLDLGSAELAGVVAGDTVTIDDDAVLAAFDTKDVGTAKPVTVSGLALTGADAGNYTVTQPAGLSAAITAKGLTVTGAAAQDKVYDGTTAATVDFTGAALVGVVGGDDVQPDFSGCTATFDTKDVGVDKPVTVAGVALAGADIANYTVTQPVGLTADITGVTPTITVSGNDDAWHSGPVTLTFTPTVGPYGLEKGEYKVGSGDWTAITPSGAIYQATITTPGVNSVSYRVTDNAGLVSAVGTCTVKIDTATPTISMIGISTGDTTWHKDPVTLTFTPHVGEAGLQSGAYQVHGGAWTAIPAGAAPSAAAR